MPERVYTSSSHISSVYDACVEKNRTTYARPGFVDRALISESPLLRFAGGTVVYGVIAGAAVTVMADKVTKSAAVGANRVLETMLDSENNAVFALGVTTVAASALVYGLTSEIKETLTN